MQVAREKSRGPPLFVIKFLEFRFSVRFCDLFIALVFNAGYWRESDRERKRLEHRKGRVTSSCRVQPIVKFPNRRSKKFVQVF